MKQRPGSFRVLEMHSGGDDPRIICAHPNNVTGIKLLPGASAQAHL